MAKQRNKNATGIDSELMVRIADGAKAAAAADATLARAEEIAGSDPRGALELVEKVGEILGAAEEMAAGKPVEVAQIRRWRIRTPVASFKGERFGIHFYDGVGFTSDERAAEACRGLGYRVSEVKD